MAALNYPLFDRHVGRWMSGWQLAAGRVGLLVKTIKGVCHAVMLFARFDFRRIVGSTATATYHTHHVRVLLSICMQTVLEYIHEFRVLFQSCKKIYARMPDIDFPNIK